MPPPPAATEPNTPNALPRSRGSWKVLTRVPSADGREERAEHALQRPGRYQDGERAGRAADGRGNGETDQAGDEDPLAAEHVADPAAHQQQAAEGQGIGRHHPLPVAIGEPQRPLGGRQRNVHNRGIQDHHQLGDSDDNQDQPASVIGRCAALLRGRRRYR